MGISSVFVAFAVRLLLALLFSFSAPVPKPTRRHRAGQGRGLGRWMVFVRFRQPSAIKRRGATKESAADLIAWPITPSGGLVYGSDF
jgi:hypothetical protein